MKTIKVKNKTKKVFPYGNVLVPALKDLELKVLKQTFKEHHKLLYWLYKNYPKVLIHYNKKLGISMEFA